MLGSFMLFQKVHNFVDILLYYMTTDLDFATDLEFLHDG